MVFILLIVFQLKHFLADYIFQNSYMLGKFKADKKYIIPLICHVGVHSIFTLIISIFYVNIYYSILLRLLDGCLHFVMDRIKASPYMLGQYKALSYNEMYEVLKLNNYNKNLLLKHNKYFWWSLGLDQMVHHLTHYLIIFFLLI